jgi:hypothetical protein
MSVISVASDRSDPFGGLNSTVILSNSGRALGGVGPMGGRVSSP